METAQGPDDRRLVERFLRFRSERTFRRLYRRHTGALFRTALRLARGNEAEAEEIVQETWVRAVPRLVEFAWRSALRTWLIGIAVHVSRERARGRAAPSGRAHLRVVEGGRDAVAKIDLERAIAGLPPGYREVLVLFDVEGYTHREIGQMLGIDPGTSKSQLSRARAALRRLLVAEGEASRG